MAHPSRPALCQDRGHLRRVGRDQVRRSAAPARAGAFVPPPCALPCPTDPSAPASVRAQYEGISRMSTSLRRRHRDRVVRRGIGLTIESDFYA